jgi:AAA domain
MVHAIAGHGKTWFGLSCAHAIATGGRFLKWTAPVPLRALYIDGEMAAQDLQDRLQTICGNHLPDLLSIVSMDLYDGPVPNIATP